MGIDIPSLAKHALAVVAKGVGIGGGLLGLGGKLKDHHGRINDQIIVTISGGPLSDMKTLHRLAVSIAFGKVRKLINAGEPNFLGRLVSLPGSITVVYSLERKAVTVVVQMDRSLNSIVDNSGLGVLENLPVFAGPKNDSVGGDWDLNPTVVDGKDLFKPVKLPTLPFNGKTVLSPFPTSRDPDPSKPGEGELKDTRHVRPVGDARSRESLVRMVTATLTGSAKKGPSTFDRPVNANRFTGG